MTFKKKLISGIGALAFVALLAMNVQLVHSESKHQSGLSLALVELAAQAQIEGGGCSSCEPWETCIDGECVDVGSGTNNGVAGAGICPDGSVWRTCGGTGSGCSPLSC